MYAEVAFTGKTILMSFRLLVDVHYVLIDVLTCMAGRMHLACKAKPSTVSVPMPCHARGHCYMSSLVAFALVLLPLWRVAFPTALTDRLLSNV